MAKGKTVGGLLREISLRIGWYGTGRVLANKTVAGYKLTDNFAVYHNMQLTELKAPGRIIDEGYILTHIPTGACFGKLKVFSNAWDALGFAIALERGADFSLGKFGEMFSGPQAENYRRAFGNAWKEMNMGGSDD